MYKVSDKTRKELNEAGKKVAKKLAKEASEKLSSQYVRLIDFYYADYMPRLDKYDEPYYTRTWNLYKSFYKYQNHSGSNIYYGGVAITPEKMDDYFSIKPYGETFKAEDMFDKFIYNKKGTWHGGDWHGGYGVKNSFNIYTEMHKYFKDLVKYYKKNYGFKK